MGDSNKENCFKNKEEVLESEKRQEHWEIRIDFKRLCNWEQTAPKLSGMTFNRNTSWELPKSASTDLFILASRSVWLWWCANMVSFILAPGAMLHNHLFFPETSPFISNCFWWLFFSEIMLFMSQKEFLTKYMLRKVIANLWDLQTHLPKICIFEPNQSMFTG